MIHVVICCSVSSPRLLPRTTTIFFFHAMTDAESDASCQAPWPQNNPQPSAPHQLPQPSVRSCNPSDDNCVENVSWYVTELIEMLLEALDGSESDGDRTVTWKNTTRQGAAPLSTSVFTEVALAHRVVKLVSHKQRPILQLLQMVACMTIWYAMPRCHCRASRN